MTGAKPLVEEVQAMSNRLAELANDLYELAAERGSAELEMLADAAENARNEFDVVMIQVEETEKEWS